MGKESTYICMYVYLYVRLYIIICIITSVTKETGERILSRYKSSSLSLDPDEKV